MGQLTLKYMSFATVWITGIIAFLIALWVVCLGLGGCLSGICALCDKIF